MSKSVSVRPIMETGFMRSMALKMVAAFTLIALVGVLVVAFLANQFTTSAFGSYVEQGVLAQDQRIADYIVGQYGSGGWRTVSSMVFPLSRWTGTRLVVADPSGKVMADSTGQLVNSSVPNPPPGRQIPLKGDGKTVGTLYVIEDSSAGGMMGGWDMGDRGMMGGWGMMGGQGWRGWANPPSNQGSTSAQATAPVVSSDNSASRYLEAVGRATWIAGGIAVGIALLLGLFLSRRITSPLGRLTLVAGRVAQGDFSGRVEVRSKDELASLGVAFNTMAESLSKAEEQRKRLFSDIAHELKTPIAIIQGNLEAIRDGVMDPTPERMASLEEETALLARLVGDLRDLSLAEAGQLKLHTRPVDLSELAKSAVVGVAVQAEERQVRVEADCRGPLLLAQADPDRIGQVLRNLIGNALRYTPAGGTIQVSTKLAGRTTGGRSFAQVSVADTGSGIPAEDLPHIFDRFYRVDKSRSRSSGGTGLGLAVVKQLIEAHGGRVWAESEVGKGTAFYFTLPVAPSMGVV